MNEGMKESMEQGNTVCSGTKHRSCV